MAAPVKEPIVIQGGIGLDLGGDHLSDGGPRGGGDFGEYHENRSYNGSNENGGGFGGYREEDEENHFEGNYERR